MLAIKNKLTAAELRQTIEKWLLGLTDTVTPSVHRLEISVSPVNLISWLAAQSSPEKFFWRNRLCTFECAGIGTACLVQKGSINEAMQELHHINSLITPPAPAPRWFGCIPFDPQYAYTQNWRTLNGCYFRLPQFEYGRHENNYFFALNIYFTGTAHSVTAVLADFDRLCFADCELAQSSFLAELPLEGTLLRQYPDKAEWTAQTQKLIHSLGAEFGKLVLARQCSIMPASDIVPVHLFAHISTLNPSAYCYYIQDASGAFFGASPEQLYEREGRLIHTEAIAGTLDITQNTREHSSEAPDLLLSVKNCHEHEYVVKDITEALAALCSHIEIPTPPERIQSNQLQHLRSAFTADLKEHINDEHILSALHPTAALLGYPRRHAAQELYLYEHFSRGWYGGPIGWATEDKAEFAVGIRCGRFTEGTFTFFAGAGIVAESVPEDEWQEINNKMNQYLTCFKVKPHDPQQS